MDSKLNPSFLGILVGGTQIVGTGNDRMWKGVVHRIMYMQSCL